MRVFTIIPAAGLGRRMNFSPDFFGVDIHLPKQFIKINGKEILVHTIEKFEEAKSVDSIFISVNFDFIELTKKLLRKYKFKKVIAVVQGGKERQHSVYNALCQIKAQPSDLICVHDAVRPFIFSDEIDEIISFGKKYKSVIAAVKSKDTVKSGKKFVEKTLDRDRVRLVQTPQIFTYEILKKAFNKAWKENFIGTDEASLVELLNKRIYFYEIKGENRKITTSADLDYAKSLLK